MFYGEFELEILLYVHKDHFAKCTCRLDLFMSRDKRKSNGFIET